MTKKETEATKKKEEVATDLFVSSTQQRQHITVTTLSPEAFQPRRFLSFSSCLRTQLCVSTSGDMIWS